MNNVRVYGTRLVVSDLSRSLSFYCDVLGLKEGRRIRLEDAGITEVQLSSGDQSSELILVEQNGAEPSPRSSIPLVVLATESIDQLADDIASAPGCVLAQPPTNAGDLLPDIPELASLRLMIAKDPDGHLLEIVQEPPD